MTSENRTYLHLEEVDGIITILVTNQEITPETGEELYTLADGLANLPAPRRVVLNLANVEALKSMAIAMLIQFQSRIKKAGGELKVSRIRPDVLRLLTLTQADKLFEIHDRQRDAIESFLGKSGSTWKALRGWFSRR